MLETPEGFQPAEPRPDYGAAFSSLMPQYGLDQTYADFPSMAEVSSKERGWRLKVELAYFEVAAQGKVALDRFV